MRVRERERESDRGTEGEGERERGRGRGRGREKRERKRERIERGRGSAALVVCLEQRSRCEQLFFGHPNPPPPHHVDVEDRLRTAGIKLCSCEIGTNTAVLA